MELGSIIRAIISPTPEKSEFRIDTLKPGDTLQGTILGARKGGKTLVDFGSFRVFADIKFPIDTGKVLHVKVMESGEQLTLKLIDPPIRLSENQQPGRGYHGPPTAQYLDRLRSALMSILQKNESLPSAEKLPSHIKDAMLVINTHFEPFDLEGQMAKLIGHLKSRVQASGIFYEKILENLFNPTATDRSAKKSIPGARLQSLVRSDLKPNLHIIKEFFNRSPVALKYFDSKEVEIIKNTVNTLFADVIDQQHNVRVVPQESEPPAFITYLLNLKDNDKLSKLRVYYAPSKRDDSSGTTRISLLLNLDKLGAIRSDLSLFKHEIHIHFFVLNHDIKHQIEENLTELESPLAALFRNLVVTVNVSKTKIADFTQTEMKRSINTKVDIRV
jgi:hypothetical protein